MYCGDYLARRCQIQPRKTALVDLTHPSERAFNYGDLDRRARRLAGWLQMNGIGKGDRVAILALDGVYHFDLLFACGKIGAISVPLNRRLHAREIESMLRQVAPSILFYGSDPELAAIVAHLRTAAVMPRLLPVDQREAISLETIVNTDDAAQPALCESLCELDTACLLFTGGTTGRPKAVQISHRQIVWNTFNAHLADVCSDDTYLNIFPLFHTGGLFAFSVPLLLLGGTVIQMPRFDAEQVLHVLTESGVSIFAGVPSVFQMLTESPNWPEANLQSLRYCLSGGAPMPVPLMQRYTREKGVFFRQGFGMTEFGPAAFSLSIGDSQRKAGSIGRPNFFVDARIANPETGEPLPPNEIGELMLRGPVATTGYFNDPEATHALFDAEGYMHTGDLAYMDEEGFYYIVDRLKDMFISGGENVYPAEVEAVLYRHPAVAGCAVIGVPDPRWGEVGRAFVVCKKGETVSENQLLAYLREHLAAYKIPKSIVFRDSLPMSAAGKVLKQVLREQAGK